MINESVSARIGANWILIHLIQSSNIESKDPLVVSFSTKVILASTLPLSPHTLGVFSFSRVRLVEYPQVLRVC